METDTDHEVETATARDVARSIVDACASRCSATPGTWLAEANGDGVVVVQLWADGSECSQHELTRAAADRVASRLWSAPRANWFSSLDVERILEDEVDAARRAA